MVNKKHIITTIVILFAILGVVILNSYLNRVNFEVYDSSSNLITNQEITFKTKYQIPSDPPEFEEGESCVNVSEDGTFSAKDQNQITITWDNESNQSVVCERERIWIDEVTIHTSNLTKEFLRRKTDCECLDKRFSGCYYISCIAGDYTIKFGQRFSIW